ATGQRAVGAQVAEGGGLLAEQLVGAAEVEVGVGQGGVEGERALVGGGRLPGALSVLQRDTQVVGGERVVRIDGERPAVMGLGPARVACLVEQSAEVGMGVGEVG